MVRGAKTCYSRAVPKSSASRLVLFVCLHGSAKSLIAAEHFTRLARERGLPYFGESAGLEPDEDVPPPVIAGLRRDGFELSGYVPRSVTMSRVAESAQVVTFGCELPAAMTDVRSEHWDDLPMVSDGFDRPRDAIVERVERLLHALARDSLV